jgi:hypothetical protein
LYVYNSGNRGQTFNHRSLISVNNNISSVSDPLLAICTLPGSPLHNRIYLLWTVITTRPDKTQFWQLMLAVSNNGGKSFTAMLQRRLNWDDAPVSNAAIEVASDGSITITWLEHKQAVQQRQLHSIDGGASFY